MSRVGLPWWRRYLPQLVALAVGLLAVLVVRAVVQDDGDDEAGFLGDRSGTTTTSGPDDEGSSTSTAPSEAAPEVDGDDEPAAGLQRLVLRLDDLPDGWAEVVEASGVQPCPAHDPVRDVPPEESHQVAFSGGQAGPFVANVVAAFRSEGRAEDFIDAAAEAIEDCGRFEQDGGEYELERFTVRGLGDESVAARITGTGGAGSVGGPIYYVRVGARVVTLAAVSIGSGSSDDLARTAVEVVVERL